MRAHVKIRPATALDAVQICDVVRASITQLCFADHKGDPDIIAQWLANKTPENVSRWLANAQNINLIARADGEVLAAGCVTVSGEVILNYVSPDARFQGVSRAILAELEGYASRHGNMRCRLDSTTTAHRFYEDRGYRDSGASTFKFGLTTYPMIKSLSI
jgi:GNAT superfamily N-acetyltransferase